MADDVKVLLAELIKRTNDSERRLRNVEMRSDRIETAMLTLEETLLNALDDLKVNFEKMGMKLNLISDKIATIEADLNKFSKEISKKASKNEFKELESYVDLTSPVKSNFVTKDELNRVLDEKFARKA